MADLYRALISVPIEATSDKEAWRIATDFANDLQVDGTVCGHVEAIRYPNGQWKDLLGELITMPLDRLER
jgi:hypothetical protein